MKNKTLLLISFFLISTVLSCDTDGKSLIKKNLQNLIDSSPYFLSLIKNSLICKNQEFNRICNGLSIPTTSDQNLYKSIPNNKECLNDFLNVLIYNLPIDEKDAKNLKSKLINLAKDNNYGHVMGVGSNGYIYSIFF